MNTARRIVVSRTLEEPEPAWSNTRLVRDVQDLAALKRQPGKEMLVMGSSVLTTSLMELGSARRAAHHRQPGLDRNRQLSVGGAERRIPLRLLSTREFRSRQRAADLRAGATRLRKLPAGGGGPRTDRAERSKCGQR